MKDLEQLVRGLLVEEFKVAEADVAPDKSFADMGLDSLDVVSLAMALEDRLSIEIPESDLEGIETLGDALELLGRKVGSRA